MNDIGYNIEMRFTKNRGHWQVTSGPRVSVIHRDRGEYAVYKELRKSRLIEVERRSTLDEAITLAVALIQVKPRTCYFLRQPQEV